MYRVGSGIRQAARTLSRHELVPLALAVPFLMFPNGWTGFAMGLIAISWGLRWIATGRPSVRTYLDARCSHKVLLVMTFVALYASVELPASWPKFWGIILGVAIYYGVSNALRSEDQVLWVCLGLLAVGIAVAMFALVSTDWEEGQKYNLSEVYRFIPRLIRDLPLGGVPRRTPFLNPREIGGTMALILPLAFSLSIGGRGWLTRILAIIATLILLIVLIFSQALSAIVGAILAVFLILLWRSRWFALLVPIGLVVPVALNQYYGSSVHWVSVLGVSHPFGASIWDRLPLWLWGFQMLGDVPLTGIGLNSFDAALVNLYPMSLYYSIAHAHNFFLQTALDLGLPGLIAFLGLLGALGYATVVGLRRIGNPNSRALLVGVAGGVLAYMVFGLIDTFTLGAKPGAAFWGMLGLTSALVKPANPSLARNRASPWVRRGGVIAAIALMTVAALTIPTIRGVFYLNLGTLQAHKALAQVRQGGAPPLGIMNSAQANLEKAVTDGRYTAHTYLLLGSMNGWMGNYPQSVEAIGKSVVLGGDQPLGSDFIVQQLSAGLGGANSSAALDPREKLAADVFHRLAQRLGLPRTQETLLERYQFMSRRLATRWQPASTWWEPYLEAAIVL